MVSEFTIFVYNKKKALLCHVLCDDNYDGLYQESEELFMQKKIFSLIVSLTLILSNLSSLNVFAAATEQQLACFLYTAPAGAAGSDLTDGDKTNG